MSIVEYASGRRLACQNQTSGPITSTVAGQGDDETDTDAWETSTQTVMATRSGDSATAVAAMRRTRSPV